MRLGDYEVLDTIGRGGMAIVFKARARDGREVAIKLLRRAPAGDALARFDRERRLLGQLGEAEGFVPLIDAGESAQGPFLVMPFVAGGTLKKRLERGPLAVVDAVEIGRELAAALGRAHALGIVHRDLKPENVLFTVHGRPLIADLGLAKHFVGSDPGTTPRVTVSVSVPGELRGTAGYMPVEQMRDAKNVGPQADVFALGAILYECLAGKPAFDAPDFYGLMAVVERGGPKPLRQVRPETPRWLARAVERCLARRAARRFADGGALERALLAEGAEDARRLSLILAAALVAVAVAATAAAIALLVRAPGRPSEPAFPAKDPATEACERGAERLARGDLDGARSELSRALELDPKLVRALLLRGQARLEKGDTEGAAADYSRAIDLAPREPSAWAGRGRAQLARGQADLAIQDLGHAVELAPKDARVLADRAFARCKKHDFENAVADGERATKADPKLASGWAARGEARAMLRDERGAIQDLDRALALDPKNAGALATRGRCRAEVHDMTGGLEDLTRAIEIDPRNAGAWHDRGCIRIHRQEWDAAIDDFSRAVEIDPLKAISWHARGLARLEKGDVDAAIYDYTRAIELEPRSPSSWEQRAVARMKRDDVENAEADMTRVIQLAPGDAEAYWNRAGMRIAKGDKAGAIGDFEKYLELVPPSEPGVQEARRKIAQLKAESGPHQ